MVVPLLLKIVPGALTTTLSAWESGITALWRCALRFLWLFDSHLLFFFLGGKQPGTHIFVSHYPRNHLFPCFVFADETPAILPSREGTLREHQDIVEGIARSGALLSVSGHCHWARGVYHSQHTKAAFVVASICGSGWYDSKA